MPQLYHRVRLRQQCHAVTARNLQASSHIFSSLQEPTTDLGRDALAISLAPCTDALDAAIWQVLRLVGSPGAITFFQSGLRDDDSIAPGTKIRFFAEGRTWVGTALDCGGASVADDGELDGTRVIGAGDIGTVEATGACDGDGDSGGNDGGGDDNGGGDGGSEDSASDARADVARALSRGGHTSKRNEALLTDVVRACKKNRDSVAKFWARIKCRGQDFDDDEIKGVVLDQEFVVPAFSLRFSGEPILPIAGNTGLNVLVVADRLGSILPLLISATTAR